MLSSAITSSTNRALFADPPQPDTPRPAALVVGSPTQVMEGSPESQNISGEDTEPDQDMEVFHQALANTCNCFRCKFGRLVAPFQASLGKLS